MARKVPDDREAEILAIAEKINRKLGEMDTVIARLKAISRDDVPSGPVQDGDGVTVS